MIEIAEMTAQECHALLQRVGYGHLGCARGGRPYVVPLHFAYMEPDIHIFTTEGLKTEFISENPEVCLQVEEVHDSAHWRSVLATGRAEKLTSPEDLEHAMQLILERNPTLTPAISKMWVDVWGRANVSAVFRIRPHTISGRKTV